MAGQVRVVAECRIHVGGQHLAVGVDQDVGAGDLGQEQLQVQQIVAGDQDSRLGPGAGADFADGGLAVAGHMGLVQHLHDPQVLLAAFQHQLQQAGHVEVDVGHGGEQGLLGEGVHRLVHPAEPAGVVGVGRHALQAVQKGLLQGLHILVLAADPEVRAPAARGRLFTLIAKHA